MSLQVRKGIGTRKSNILFTAAAVFALLVQPMYGLVANKVANAAAGDPVCLASNSECYGSVQDAIDAAAANDTVSINSNLVLTQSIRIAAKSNITINGNGNTLSAGFLPNGNERNAAINFVNSSATVNNLSLVGTSGNNIWGINTFKNIVNLNNVSISGFNYEAGLLVNNATVNATNLSTANNYGNQRGVYVKQGTGSANPSVFNIHNTSSHTETTGILLEDFATRNVTLNDINGQYVVTTSGANRLYNLPAPEFVSMGATYRKDTYKGINVDIRTNYLTDAVAVEVKVDRSAGGPVVKTAKTPTLALLNTGATGGTTAPIVIQSGAYNEAGSGSWNMPTATWTAGTLPTSVTVTITRANGSTLIKTVSLGEVAGPHATRSEIMPANQAPVGSVTSPVNGDTAGTANGKLVVKGLVNDDLGQMNYVYAQLVKPGVSGGLVQGYHHMVYQNPGAWEIELNVKNLGLTDGAYGLNIKYMDMQGNMSQERVDFVIDNTYPTFAINSPVNGSYVRGTVNLKAEIKDENDISKVLMNIGGISRSWNEGASTTITQTGDIFSTNVDTTTLPDGAVYTTLRGTDGVGNVRYWNNNANTRQHVFYVDNTAPEVVTQVSPDNNTRIANGKLSLRFTVSDSGSGVKQVNIHIFQNNTTMLIVPLQHMGGDTWGVDDFDISDLDDGTYSFVSRAQDNVGNTRVGTGTNHGTIIVDTTAPILTDVTAGGSLSAETPTPEDDEDDDAPTNFIAFLPGTIGGIGINNGPATTPLPTVPATNNNNSDDTDVLGAEDTKPNWSVVNAALAGFVTILAVVGLAGIRRKETDADNNTGARIFMIVPAAAAVIAFIVIEGFNGPMIWFNVWTWLFAGILVVQAIVATLTTRTAND